MSGTMNTVQQSTEPKSPTTIILEYLQSKGVKPSSTNVRQALEDNARDPGVIPGLRSDTAATEAEDQAAMRAAGKGGGGGGQGLPVPPIPPSSTPTNELTADQGKGGSQITSAQPTDGNTADGSGGISPAMMILGGLGIPALAGAGYGLYNRARQGGYTPGAADAGAPVPDAPPVAPMEAAMQRATAGPEPLQPPMEGVKPYQPTAPGVEPVPPAMVQGMQSGPTTPDPAVVNEARIRSGEVPAPRVPFRPKVGGGPRVPPNLEEIVRNLSPLLRGLR